MAENPFCYGVDDYERFERECKITLYPQQWNIWRVVINADRYVDKSQIQDALERLFSFLVGSGLDLPTFVENYYSPVDSVQWSFEPPKNLGKKVADRLFDCYQPMWLTGNNYHDVYVRFVFRGFEKQQITWPAYKEWNLAYAQCPTDADMFLDKAYAPSEEPIPEDPEGKLPDIIDPTQSVTGALLWGGAALVAFLGVRSLLK